jgi:hypothetical protein
VTLEEAFATFEELYRCEHNGTEFIFRPLNRKEFEILLQGSSDGFDFEDNVCFHCVISPERFDYGNCIAGLPAMLCITILNVSGIGGTDASVSMLEEARAAIQSDFDRQMDCVIMSAFPQYRQDEMQTWTRRKLFDMFAQAEWVLKEIRGLTLGTQIGSTPQQQGVPKLPPPPKPLGF